MKGQAVNALCQMTGLNRAGFYRSRRLRQASPVEMEIRDEMQKIALESPAYGYRRITVELQRRGFDTTGETLFGPAEETPTGRD